MSITLLLVEMPRMLRDVVRNILDVEPDLRVVADGVETGSLLERVEQERPDVVVLLAESGSPPELCEELLARCPRMAVVALEDHGLRGSIYRMRPTRSRLAEISSAELVTAICRAARPMRFLASLYDTDAPFGDAAIARGLAKE